MTESETKFVICFDTMCQGYHPVTDENNEPVLYGSEEEAQKEIESDPEFYSDPDTGECECFVVTLEEIGHKTIYTGD